jgi:hypothetical protein
MLTSASKTGNVELIKFLYEKGGNPQIKNYVNINSYHI